MQPPISTATSPPGIPVLPRPSADSNRTASRPAEPMLLPLADDKAHLGAPGKRLSCLGALRDDFSLWHLLGGGLLDFADRAVRTDDRADDRGTSFRPMGSVVLRTYVPLVAEARHGLGRTYARTERRRARWPGRPLRGRADPSPPASTSVALGAQTQARFPPPPSRALHLPGPPRQRRSHSSRHRAVAVETRGAPVPSVVPTVQPRRTTGVAAKPVECV